MFCLHSIETNLYFFIFMEPESAPVPPPAPRYNFPNASAQIGGRTVWLLGGRLCWSDALLYCRRHHWDLLSIHSQDEQTQVEQLIAHTSLSPLSDHGTWSLFWLWINGQRLGYTNWCRGEPSNSGRNEACALINWSEAKCWNDGRYALTSLFFSVKHD
uniref:C-type lectin domain-containing protein n=1 Tax=Periophthalmus magnuspinnatus TaxID=409849 RepID=A0A3B3ZSA3_9GOBI